jgi:hypothetical protein
MQTRLRHRSALRAGKTDEPATSNSMPKAMCEPIEFVTYLTLARRHPVAIRPPLT